VKLQEIREKYLSLQMDERETLTALFHAGMFPVTADELMALWVSDEWERSERAKGIPPHPLPDLDSITDAELIEVLMSLTKMSDDQRRLAVLLGQAMIEGTE